MTSQGPPLPGLPLTLQWEGKPWRMGANQYARPREISRFPLRECSVCPTGFHKRNRNPKKSTLGEGVAVLGIAHGDRRLRQGCLCRSWTPCGNGESCGCAPLGSQVCGVLARGREVMWPHVDSHGRPPQGTDQVRPGWQQCWPGDCRETLGS